MTTNSKPTIMEGSPGPIKGLCAYCGLLAGQPGCLGCAHMVQEEVLVCPKCLHRWGAYEDDCHCNGGICHNHAVCGSMNYLTVTPCNK